MQWRISGQDISLVGVVCDSCLLFSFVLLVSFLHSVPVGMFTCSYDNQSMVLSGGILGGFRQGKR